MSSIGEIFLKRGISGTDLIAPIFVSCHHKITNLHKRREYGEGRAVVLLVLFDSEHNLSPRYKNMFVKEPIFLDISM